ncbi:isoamylase [Trifolium repens]|nr:isoamylase [Trifolium repens]
MIAKQGWNMLTNPNSLVAKLYKARWSIGSVFFAVSHGMHVESVVLCLYDGDDIGVEKPPLEIDFDPYVNMNHAFDHGLLKKEP